MPSLLSSDTIKIEEHILIRLNLLIDPGWPQDFYKNSVQIPYMIFFNPYSSVHKIPNQFRTFRTQKYPFFMQMSRKSLTIHHTIKHYK